MATKEFMTTNFMHNFNRTISYRVLANNNDEIYLLATMNDKYHDIEVYVIVEQESLEIKTVEVMFNKTPNDWCTDVRERVGVLKGRRIGEGVFRCLAETFGGPTGCGNLRTIFSGLLPLAINARSGHGVKDEAAFKAVTDRHLRGTCAGYPLNGRGD